MSWNIIILEYELVIGEISSYNEPQIVINNKEPVRTDNPSGAAVTWDTHIPSFTRVTHTFSIWSNGQFLLRIF